MLLVNIKRLLASCLEFNLDRLEKEERSEKRGQRNGPLVYKLVFALHNLLQNFVRDGALQELVCAGVEETALPKKVFEHV